MTLHGHTKIILQNPDGTRRQYEKDNALTPALAELFTPLGMYTNGECLCENLLNVTRLFGGLLAFDQPLDPAVPTYPGSAGIVASGVYNAANNGANEIRGTYNTTESLIDWNNKTLRFVYDFATNQGNGTLRSICLTPLYGGYMGECKTRTLTDYCTRFPLDDLDYYWQAYGGSPASSNRYDQYSAFRLIRRDCVGYGANNGDSTNQTGYAFRCIELDETNDTRLEVWLKGTNANKNLSLVLRTMPAFLKSGNLFEMMGTAPAYTEEEIPLGEGMNDNRYFYRPRTETLSYDWERRKVYVCSFPHHEYSYNGTCCYIEPEENIRVFEVDVDTHKLVTYNLANQTGVRLAKGRWDDVGSAYPSLCGFCYDGCIYFTSCDSGSRYDTPHTLYKISLADPGQVAAFPTKYPGNEEPWVMYAAQGRIYTGYRYIINTQQMTNHLWYELRPDESRLAVPIRGRSALLTMDGKFAGLRPNTLMTVNNIEPITKTAAQTMKIIYTLTGE